MITVLYNYYAPAYKAGGPIQSLVNLVSHLDSSKIRIVCSNKDLDGTSLNVPFNKWVLDSTSSIFFSSKGFCNFSKHLLKQDVLFLNGIYSLNYNFLPALLLSGRKIISVRGMLHPDALAQKPFKKKIYLLIWKFLKLHVKCEYHATSVEEEGYIKKNFGSKCKVWVIPNLPKVIQYQKPVEKVGGHLILCTIALISPMKNHLPVLEALKECKENILYNIYGPIKDLNYWKQCKAAIQNLPSNITVIYHGEIQPSVIVEALAKAHVIIQPSKSENFGHSIVEALMAGRPVITSNTTPWNNLSSNKAGTNIFVDRGSLKKAISFFARFDNNELIEWSNNARRYALSSIDLEMIVSEYRQMFEIT
jgi:glycosyltransferase involved in cell wall biosynthesis